MCSLIHYYYLLLLLSLYVKHVNLVRNCAVCTHLVKKNKKVNKIDLKNIQNTTKTCFISKMNPAQQLWLIYIAIRHCIVFLLIVSLSTKYSDLCIFAVYKHILSSILVNSLSPPWLPKDSILLACNNILYHPNCITIYKTFVTNVNMSSENY